MLLKLVDLVPGVSEELLVVILFVRAPVKVSDVSGPPVDTVVVDVLSELPFPLVEVVRVVTANLGLVEELDDEISLVLLLEVNKVSVLVVVSVTTGTESVSVSVSVLEKSKVCVVVMVVEPRSPVVVIVSVTTISPVV